MVLRRADKKEVQHNTKHEIHSSEKEGTPTNNITITDTHITNKQNSSALRAIIGLWMYIGFVLLVFILSFFGIISYEDPSVETNLNIGDRLVYFGVMLLVVRRMYSSYKQLYSLGLKNLSHSPSWSFWGWIIPIGSWIIPFNIVRELYKGYYALLQNKTENRKKIAVPNKILWRQISRIVCSIAVTARPNDDESGLILFPLLGFLVSCYILKCIIKEISQMESKV